MSSDIIHKDHADDDAQTLVVSPAVHHVGALASVATEAPDVTLSPSRSLGPQRKRAPLTSVACQDCRRRKTKCDGQKPVCSNCLKRGASHCFYDLEPNQSRVAAYKQKIEHQINTIQALENEVRRLKEPQRPFNLGSSTPTPSSTVANGGGGLPIKFLMNPAPELGHENTAGTNLQRQQQHQKLPAFDQLQTSASQQSQREAELLSHQRSLEAENRSLRELVLLLNSVEDRETAQQMAQEINIHGVTDHLLARAQQIFASHAHIWTPLVGQNSGEARRQTSSERPRPPP